MQTRGIRYFIKQGVKKNNHYAPLPGVTIGVGVGAGIGDGEGVSGAPGTFGSIGVSGPPPGFVFGPSLLHDSQFTLSHDIPAPSQPESVLTVSDQTVLPRHTKSSVIIEGVLSVTTVVFLFSDTNFGLLIIIISFAHLLYSARKNFIGSSSFTPRTVCPSMSILARS